MNIEAAEVWRAEQVVLDQARVAARKAGAKWETSDMITMRRAEAMARKLFPVDWSDGVDCGDSAPQPCWICADRWAGWRALVDQVRTAMIEVMS